MQDVAKPAHLETITDPLLVQAFAALPMPVTAT